MSETVMRFIAGFVFGFALARLVRILIKEHKWRNR